MRNCPFCPALAILPSMFSPRSPLVSQSSTVDLVDHVHHLGQQLEPGDGETGALHVLGIGSRVAAKSAQPRKDMLADEGVHVPRFEVFEVLPAVALGSGVSCRLCPRGRLYRTGRRPTFGPDRPLAAGRLLFFARGISSSSTRSNFDFPSSGLNCRRPSHRRSMRRPTPISFTARSARPRSHRRSWCRRPQSGLRDCLLLIHSTPQ